MAGLSSLGEPFAGQRAGSNPLRLPRLLVEPGIDIGLRLVLGETVTLLDLALELIAFERTFRA